MKLLHSITLLFVAGVLFSSCDIINPTELTPTYVQIDSFNFQDKDPEATGSISNEITAVWVYLDGNPLGVFDVPSTFPVLISKDSKLTVGPGVVYSGLKNYQALYPFYAFDTMTLKVNPGEVTNFKPKTNYVDGLNFPFKEDFEVGNKFVRLVPDYEQDTSLARTSDVDKVFEGGGSGYIYLDGAHPSCQMINNTAFKIPIGTTYLELDFKCSVPFEIGLFANRANGSQDYRYFQGFNPKNEWTKIYVALESYTNAFQGKEYLLMLKAVLPEGQANGYVLMDNLKIVTY